MKIVHLIDYFQPKVGYQEYFLAREHQKLGHEVTVLTSDRYFPFSNYKSTYGKILGGRKVRAGNTIEEGIKVKRLFSFEVVPGSLVILFGLAQALKELKPDIIFCHNVYSITSFFISWYKSKVGYKLIYDTHASPFNTNFSTILKRIYYFFFKKVIMPKIKKSADTIFAIGEEEQKFICDNFSISRKTIPIIHLGADTQLFSFSRKFRQSVRKQLGIAENDILVVYAGKVTQNKDLHILFTAVKVLNNRNIKILIIGGGDKNYIAKVKKILNGNQLIWRDLVENKKLSSFFSAADLGIWPGDPSAAMLEAMACRVGLILPKWRETEYLDTSGGVVRFVRSDAEGLANCLDKVVENREIREKLAKNAENYVKKELSWEKIAEKTLKLVKNY